MTPLRSILYGLAGACVALGPAMVDVSAKAVTAREAVAECRVRFPVNVAETLRAATGNDLGLDWEGWKVILGTGR